MDSNLKYVQFLAETTLSGMGGSAPDWEVDTVSYYDLDAGECTEKWSEAVYLSLRSSSRKYEEVWVYFVNSDLTLAQTTINTVDAIQDHAVEVTDGEPLPPCPGHMHPLVARIVDGVPTWVCMKEGVAHYAREILPNFDPDFARSEEYVLLSGQVA